MSDEDKLVQLNVLRVKHNFRKNCECENRHLIIDVDNHIVECGECGAYLDPFEALVGLASDHQLLNDQSKALMEQQKQLRAYKPRLKVIKRLEQQYRGHKMLPCCPKCSEPFYLEEINSWMNANFYSLSVTDEVSKENKHDIGISIVSAEAPKVWQTCMRHPDSSGGTNVNDKTSHTLLSL